MRTLDRIKLQKYKFALATEMNLLINGDKLNKQRVGIAGPQSRRA